MEEDDKDTGNDQLHIIGEKLNKIEQKTKMIIWNHQ